jgi:SAM-dependent methyltransferase
MSMQDFWHRQGQNGTWSGYYDGAADLKTYNFFTRREAVLELLRRDGAYPRILDVGCGTGDYVEVAQQHDGSFFGIDYAHGMIRQAAERIPGHLFVVGSGEHLPYADGSFDLVMAMGYIEYFRDPAVPMRELRRVLKSGGTLVLQSFKKDLFGELDRLVFNPLEHAAAAAPPAPRPGPRPAAGLVRQEVLAAPARRAGASVRLRALRLRVQQLPRVPGVLAAAAPAPIHRSLRADPALEPVALATPRGQLHREVRPAQGGR